MRLIPNIDIREDGVLGKVQLRIRLPIHTLDGDRRQFRELGKVGCPTLVLPLLSFLLTQLGGLDMVEVWLLLSLAAHEILIVLPEQAGEPEDTCQSANSQSISFKMLKLCRIRNSACGIYRTDPV